MNQDFQEQLKLIIGHSLYESETPGAAFAVHINGQPSLETSVGYQDIKREVLLPNDAKFYIYSITKSIIATAALSLVNQGQLELDVPVQPYLPNFSVDTSVTLRQLLSHTSGLVDYGETSTYGDAVKATPSFPWSVEAFLDFAKTQGLRFTPGKGWAYSNIGYLVLRCVLEAVTGLSIQQLLQKVIFKPLSLQETFVPNTLYDVRELTPGYSDFFSENQLQDVTRFYHPGWVAHSVIVSTAPELALMMDALFTGKLLNPLVFEQMLCPVHILGKHPLLNLLGYGMGLFLGIDSPYGTVGGHVGEGPGYSVAAFHFPNLAGSRVTLAALANRERHDFGLQLVFKMVRKLMKIQIKS
ncbi:serine hydrolase domain-containing protein [Gloeocapsopsis dulcis]|uniref:serine hydrolase domain-containing protein n=1 Tax=Gloeocapsopsis dulcis TaxID=2859516 RepID=UPI00137965E0|nr:serine hydrolase domain-containing protein [Gloeocapsopsis dulcis]WNN88799.1 serine hydrolase [Gloeocapsopsis dulcis]